MIVFGLLVGIATLGPGAARSEQTVSSGSTGQAATTRTSTGADHSGLCALPVGLHERPLVQGLDLRCRGGSRSEAALLAKKYRSGSLQGQMLRVRRVGRGGWSRIRHQPPWKRLPQFWNWQRRPQRPTRVALQEGLRTWKRSANLGRRQARHSRAECALLAEVGHAWRAGNNCCISGVSAARPTGTSQPSSGSGNTGGGGGTTTASTPPELTEMLKAHNEKRALHGSPPLSWDVGLAAGAQSWAAACTRQHSGFDKGYGENLYREQTRPPETRSIGGTPRTSITAGTIRSNPITRETPTGARRFVTSRSSSGKRPQSSAAA